MPESITGKKVLVVEDDVFLVNILKAKLTSEGLTILVASDGNQALDIIKRENPDLVLLDLMLPKKSGFELLEEFVSMSGQAKKIPILIISNLGREADIQRGKSLGATEYFVKAKLSIDELVQKVKQYLQE